MAELMEEKKGYYRIAHALPVGFCGSTRKLYNVHSEPCTHAVIEIEEYYMDEPNPNTEDEWKGLAKGLTCWDILQWYTHDILSMDCVSLNGIHPYRNDTKTCLQYDGNLSFHNSKQS
jgi:hypothetical protein